MKVRFKVASLAMSYGLLAGLFFLGPVKAFADSSGILAFSTYLKAEMDIERWDHFEEVQNLIGHRTPVGKCVVSARPAKFVWGPEWLTIKTGHYLEIQVDRDSPSEKQSFYLEDPMPEKASRVSCGSSPGTTYTAKDPDTGEAFEIHFCSASSTDGELQKMSMDVYKVESQGTSKAPKLVKVNEVRC